MNKAYQEILDNFRELREQISEDIFKTRIEVSDILRTEIRQTIKEETERIKMSMTILIREQIHETIKTDFKEELGRFLEVKIRNEIDRKISDLKDELLYLIRSMEMDSTGVMSWETIAEKLNAKSAIGAYHRVRRFTQKYPDIRTQRGGMRPEEFQKYLERLEDDRPSSGRPPSHRRADSRSVDSERTDSRRLDSGRTDSRRLDLERRDTRPPESQDEGSRYDYEGIHRRPRSYQDEQAHREQLLDEFNEEKGLLGIKKYEQMKEEE